MTSRRHPPRSDRPAPAVRVLAGAGLTGVLLGALLLAGCSGNQVARNLGLIRDSPDEFTVTTRAPLSMPTDGTLPVPQPGAPRPQEPAAQLAAEASLAPSIELGSHAGGDSAGQAALLAAAGPPAPADIRARVDAEARRVNSNAGIGSTLSFWAAAPKPGRVINPVKEAARLRAAGDPVVAPGAPLAP